MYKVLDELSDDPSDVIVSWCVDPVDVSSSAAGLFFESSFKCIPLYWVTALIAVL